MRSLYNHIASFQSLNPEFYCVPRSSPRSLPRSFLLFPQVCNLRAHPATPVVAPSSWTHPKTPCDLSIRIFFPITKLCTAIGIVVAEGLHATVLALRDRINICTRQSNLKMPIVSSSGALLVVLVFLFKPVSHHHQAFSNVGI